LPDYRTGALIDGMLNVVDDIHLHPALPRSGRIGLPVAF
jgi:hypothetical protein